MTDREWLINVLNEAFIKSDDNYGIPNIEQVADYLIANGVIMPPCKVGDTVYCFAPCFDELHHAKLKVVESEIVEMRTIATVLGLNFDVDRIGKTVFLTREEAEKALKERSEK